MLMLTDTSFLSYNAGFEGRVVFYAFTPYIKLQPPWNYVAVTSALFGFVALCVAHITGALGTAMDVALAGSCLLLCTTAGALAAGIPFQWLPAPLIAASGLALYYESRSLKEYAIFVVGALLTAGWFIYHHFWFLDIRVGPMHLHTMCKLAFLALLPALFVPGMVVNRAYKSVIGALLLIQAELLCILEEQMFAAHHHEDPGSETMYPAYLVIATSIAGAAATYRLHLHGYIPEWSAWVVSALLAAKLAMLVLPEAYLVLPTGVLLLAAVSPLFLYKQAAGKRRVRIAPWQGLAHVLLVLVATALARFAVFDVIQWAVMGRPSEGVLLGALLLTFALACMPLVSHCYAHSQVSQSASW